MFGFLKTKKNNSNREGVLDKLHQIQTDKGYPEDTFFIFSFNQGYYNFSELEFNHKDYVQISNFGFTFTKDGDKLIDRFIGTNEIKVGGIKAVQLKPKKSLDLRIEVVLDETNHDFYTDIINSCFGSCKERKLKDLIKEHDNFPNFLAKFLTDIKVKAHIQHRGYDSIIIDINGLEEYIVLEKNVILK